jgi:adenosylhomocysteine nucleosidase
MKIGIVCAMNEELAPMLDKIENKKVLPVGNHIFYEGTLNGKNVILTVSGIGKVQAALTTSVIINVLKTDIVINTGSAGGLRPSSEIKIGDIVVSSGVAYHDVDLTNFGYKPGQLPEHSLYFKADDKLVEIAMSCKKLANHKGLIVSGDQFVCTNEQHSRIIKNFPDAMATEMEGASVGHVCTELSVPFVVIRSISDTADHKSTVDFDEFLTVASRNSSLIALHLLENL